MECRVGGLTKADLGRSSLVPVQVTGSALVSFRERQQLLLGIRKAAFTGDLAKPSRQLSVMRPVQFATSPDRRSSEQRFESDKDERGRGERRKQGRARQRLARRQPRELALYEFEIVGDRVQIAAGLIDLSQRERAFVWHNARWAR